MHRVIGCSQCKTWANITRHLPGCCGRDWRSCRVDVDEQRRLEHHCTPLHPARIHSHARTQVGPSPLPLPQTSGQHAPMSHYTQKPICQDPITSFTHHARARYLNALGEQMCHPCAPRCAQMRSGALRCTQVLSGAFHQCHVWRAGLGTMSEDATEIFST